LTALRILFATAFVFATCRAAGFLLFRAISLNLRRGERLFLEFVTGSALVSTLIFFLAVCQLVYTSVMTAIGAVVVLAALYFRRPKQPRRPAVSGPVHSASFTVPGLTVNLSAVRSRRPAPTAPGDEPGTSLPLLWKFLFWVPYLLFGAMYLVTAMLPEMSPDGTAYHVGLIARYYDHRGFYAIPTSLFSGLAQGIEMLFLLAFALGRHSAAATVHLLFLLTLPFGMLAWARRAGVPKAGVLAAMLFYLAPVAGRDGTIAYIDVATAAVVFACFQLLEIWRAERNDVLLIPAGILAGFAYACKITAAPALVFAVLYVLAVSKSPRRAVTTSLWAALIALPWVAKTTILFHNPFYPVFNHWFPNPWQYVMTESEMRLTMQHLSGVAWWQVPWEAIAGGKLAGIIGPVFLLSPLALLTLRSKTGRFVLLGFLLLFLPFYTNIGTRFLIPCLPFLCVALAMAILSVPRAGTALAALAIVAHAGLSWPYLIDRWSPVYQWRIDHSDWRAALRITPEKEYLEETWNDYKPGLMLDRYVPPGDRVFSPAMGQMAYQHREVLGTFESALGRRAYLLFITALEPQLAKTWNREIHFPPVKTSRVRLTSATRFDNDLRIGELRFALGKAEIPRAPSWRLTASTNPWEIPLAFDNSPVSFWTSGETVYPGLFVEVNFGKPVELDRMLVAQSEDERWISLRPSALVEGKWQKLRSRESDLLEQPRSTLRMEIREEWKSMGIRWILIPDRSYGADDLRKNALYWGITQVATTNGYRLWKLD
jgi:hypothetical protein